MGRTRTSFAYHPAYEYVIPGVPFDPLRGQRVLGFLYDEGLIAASDLLRAAPASLEQISRAHDTKYLDRFDHPETMDSVLGYRIEEDRWQEYLDGQRTAVGGTVEAARVALRTGSTAVNLCGGFHHAFRDKGMGFCLLNDIAIAVACARSRGFDEQILIIDLDLHDGNGTRAAFAADRTVYTFSIHNETWSSVSAHADTAIALGPDVTDEAYLSVIENEIPSVVDAVEPGLIFMIAGVDVAEDDLLGNWRISAAGILRRDKFVIDKIRTSRRPTPVVILLGGGYGERAWCHSARSLAWLLSGEEVDPTEDVDTIVRRFRRLEGDALPAKESVSTRDGIADWTLSEEDLQLIVPPEGRDTRVLGEYSKHGIELTLERLGILSQVRAKGFSHPCVTVNPASSLGHTIRIYGDQDQQEVLMELRIRRDRTTMAGMDLLYAEWLLLQNPRASFAAGRPRLPDQEYPGLGLLAEVVALMVVMCERAGLDGIAFVPAHYYMAALGRRHLVFFNSEDAVVYEAMERALSGLPLAEATGAIERGKVLDAMTGSAVPWHTPLMMLPVSDQLRKTLAASEGEALGVPQYEVRDAR